MGEVECWLLRRRLLSTSRPRPSSRTLVPEADDDGTQAAGGCRVPSTGPTGTYRSPTAPRRGAGVGIRSEGIARAR